MVCALVNISTSELAIYESFRTKTFRAAHMSVYLSIQYSIEHVQMHYSFKYLQSIFTHKEYLDETVNIQASLVHKY